MNYDKLVSDVAARSGQSTETVRNVLFHFPDALLHLAIGDDVRTPLGVFRMTRTKGRDITLPDGNTTAKVAPKTQVKLRPGRRLKLED